MSGCKLNPVAFGLAIGVLWGISVLMLGLASTYYAYGHDFVVSLGSLYPGYTPSIKGSILGAIIAFIDSFIMGFIIIWLYNKFCNCGCACCDKEVKTKKVTKVKE